LQEQVADRELVLTEHSSILRDERRTVIGWEERYTTRLGYAAQNPGTRRRTVIGSERWYESDWLCGGKPGTWR
jgi:hypothetical protein